MNKQKITKFLQSFVAIPLLATSMQMTGVSALPSGTLAINQIRSMVEVSAITPQEAEAIKTNKENAAKIDQYFESINSPLVGYGQKFVDEAIANDIDPLLLPAITVRESTAYIHACQSEKGRNNGFGWNGCSKSFKSVNEAIEVVAKNLGGNNPKTAHHYDKKTNDQILKKYNSVIPRYTQQVVKIMKDIDSIETEKVLALS